MSNSANPCHQSKVTQRDVLIQRRILPRDANERKYDTYRDAFATFRFHYSYSLLQVRRRDEITSRVFEVISFEIQATGL